MTGPTALICGVTGQDGAYLARLLRDEGYRVVGTTRDAGLCDTSRLAALGVLEEIEVASMQLGDFRSVLQTLDRVGPDEVYNLAGQSSVGLSFEQPVETLESIVTGTLNLLESVRFMGGAIRLYNASSGECFGDSGATARDESAPFAPRSPYGVSKAAAHWLVANYRDAYGMYACNGILFNHESPLRPERFVTRKIARGAARIAAGLQDQLVLGSLDVARDWGWAPEYVDAMWRMLRAEEPADYVVATGRAISLRRFVEVAFEHVDLDWRAHVVLDEALARPAEIRANCGDATRARERLGWAPRHAGEAVVRLMVDAEREVVAAEAGATP